MTAKRITRRILKLVAYILGIILVLMTAFHFWFINHAESLVEDMVSAQSDGKLKLQVKRFKFNWFNYKMELRKSIFYSADTTAPTTYQFSVEKINIKVKEIFPLVFEKSILIDSIYLLRPDIRVTQWRAKDTSASNDTSLSLPQEMGRIYNSIQDALQVLKVDRFHIDNGKFSLIDKTRPADPPVVITNIHFRLENLQVDTTRPGTEQKILFSDNVSLHTNNQDILFPDGRHRLSFRGFRIDILNKMAEFDSCTVVATKGDSAASSFSIFFDKLRMTNIDFSTLYHHEIIKADSVYCINPKFRLDVDIAKKDSPAKSLPRLDELVQELTGDMQLAFVVVENGAFDINTMREGRLSSFTSDHNNFELQGLQIKAKEAKPLTVEKFVMAIRNYENFLRDSTYSIQFDSVLLYNNRISLSNFTYQELQHNKPINTLRMPQFELQGLSWDDLVFGRKLKAQTVTLYRPVIDYKLTKNKRNDTQDIFQALAGIGSFMQLQNLNINDGRINLIFKNNAQLKLENADMYVLGEKLVGSKKLQNIQRSVVGLNFKKGSFEMGNVTADLSDVNFTGGENNRLKAGTIHVKNKNNLDINAQSVAINSMIINDKIQQTAISGVSWARAAILLFSLPSSGETSVPAFALKDIKAANTTVTANDETKKMSLFLQNFQADEIATTADKKPFITGLVANGNDLHIDNGVSQLTVKTIRLADHQPSSFEDIRYSHVSSDSIQLSVPKLEIVPDVNAILRGKYNLGNVHVFNPSFDFNLVKNNDPPMKWPDANINRLTIENPRLHFVQTNEFGQSKLDWEGNNTFDITGLHISASPARSASAEQLNLTLQHFLYVNTKGKTFDAGDGKLTVQLNKLALRPNDVGQWDWKAVITHLDAADFVVDSLGKKDGKLTIESARLDNFSVSSATLLSPRDLIRQNSSFRLQKVTGSYANSVEQFRWFNTEYDKNTRIFSADSFSYRPVSDRETFIANAPYQTDYIVASSGAIHIGPFNIDSYIKDTVLEMGMVHIKDWRMTDYRDQRQPREPGVVRGLPVNLLKQIPVHLLVDTVRMTDAHIEYEEVNPKTNAAGKIAVARLNGQVTHLRNYDWKETDSLHISASAYLEDTLFTQLYLKESYTDSLGGFLMDVQMGPADLTILNNVLRPLASAELRSGKLDSMTMQVRGREAFAVGEMKMVYHDFKVNVINTNTNKKRGLLSLLANSFIKNKNTDKKGTVYFNRLRDRSAINYLVKTTLSGVSSSIGIKKTDRQARRNKQSTSHPQPK